MKRGNIALLAVVLLFLLAGGLLGDGFTSWSRFGVLLAAFLTLAVLSFLVADNPVYKLAEHVFVGVAAGYTLAVSFWQVFVPNLWDRVALLLAGKLEGAEVLWTALLFVPALLGILFFLRFVPKLAWMSRWSIAFLVGAYAGVNCTGYFQADLVMQASSTFVDQGNMNPATSSYVQVFLYNVPILVGVLATLTYFFFSKPHKGVIGASARLGIFFLMAAFGASFGYTVMARISLFVGRVQFLFGDWLHIG
ncbi:MAG: hypothetical protein ACC662_01310 [Planctomycetota bacterium]